VGTQNMEQPSTMGQPQTGQPQGIAPTVGVMVGVFKSLFTNEYIRGVKNKIPIFYILNSIHRLRRLLKIKKILSSPNS